MYASPCGKSSNVSDDTPKLLAKTSLGVDENQSVIENVLFSEKLPLSNTRINSAPFSMPFNACGMPAGIYQSSFSCTISIQILPSRYTEVNRTSPLITNVHSASLCQCISRTPPGVKRMLTPATCLEIGNSRSVTSRDQPPCYIRTCVSEYENFILSSVPPSVAGGTIISGF